MYSYERPFNEISTSIYNMYSYIDTNIVLYYYNKNHIWKFLKNWCISTFPYYSWYLWIIHVMDLYVNDLIITTAIQPVTPSTLTDVTLSAYSQTSINTKHTSHYAWGLLLSSVIDAKFIHSYLHLAQEIYHYVTTDEHIDTDE